MALKDWKKYGQNTWGRKESYAGFGTPTPGHRLEISSWDGNFIVRKLIRGSSGWNTYKIKSFKTKSQALKFVKSYMRSN